jgi:hypothetical protein
VGYYDKDQKKHDDDDAYLTIPAKRYYVIGDIVIPKWTGYIFLSGIIIQQFLFALVLGVDLIGSFYLAIGLWYWSKNVEFWFIFFPLYTIVVLILYVNIRHNHKESEKQRQLKSVQPLPSSSASPP